MILNLTRNIQWLRKNCLKGVIMRVFLTMATLLLLVVALVLGGCGTGGSDIEKVNLTFGGVSAIDENGNVSVTKGEDFTAVASLVYIGEGPVTGEWTVDGTTREVEATLPAREKVDEDDSEFATFPLELALPTGSNGVHDVSFTLKSPRKIETNSISYTVSNAAPPANANEYSVSFRLGKGFCITSAEPAIKGKEELALAITIANIKSQSETRVLVEGDAGKIYPPGQKIDTTEGAPFDWNSSIGGPWTLDATDTLNIKAYLYEIDAGGFIDANTITKLLVFSRLLFPAALCRPGRRYTCLISATVGQDISCSN
jgi:hypothetical protein